MAGTKNKQRRVKCETNFASYCTQRTSNHKVSQTYSLDSGFKGARAHRRLPAASRDPKTIVCLPRGMPMPSDKAQNGLLRIWDQPLLCFAQLCSALRPCLASIIRYTAIYTVQQCDSVSLTLPPTLTYLTYNSYNVPRLCVVIISPIYIVP